MGNLSKRKGKVVINREVLTSDPTTEYFKALFSDFYPVSTENNHSKGIYELITFYGYSPHFRELEEGELIPEYLISFVMDKDGIRFSGVKEVKEGC